MKDYYLIDVDHNYNAIRQDRIYNIASQMALKCGNAKKRYERYTHDLIREYWKYDDPCPSLIEFRNKIKVSSIKWYIHNKMNVNEPIWSADFLHGFASHGEIKWSKNRFPDCEWNNKKYITEVMQSCPYGGDISSPINLDIYKWSGVPALYLKHKEDSIGFMAGVMTGTTLVKQNKTSYAQCNKNVLPYIQKWGIPIEGKCMVLEDLYYLISPFWPALFSRFMPDNVAKKWINVKKSCNASLYASILWKTYVNSEFPVEGIPYLKGRRMIFYDFQCEEGAMEKIDQLRVEKNLTQLDNVIKEAVKEWAKK